MLPREKLKIKFEIERERVMRKRKADIRCILILLDPSLTAQNDTNVAWIFLSSLDSARGSITRDGTSNPHFSVINPKCGLSLSIASGNVVSCPCRWTIKAALTSITLWFSHDPANACWLYIERLFDSPCANRQFIRCYSTTQRWTNTNAP